uniref:glycoside hydrolase family 99-like domain-containing protein n=1 Tax=Parapedobacter defluvii TaxID=2045106 RepID=UPI00333F73CC
PFLPVVGAGYDMRPWAADHPTLPASDYWYSGVTPEKIAEHLAAGIRWVKGRRAKTLGEMVVLYAWNENGEGAWLTPTKSGGTARLDQIKQVIKQEALTNEN